MPNDDTQKKRNETRRNRGAAAAAEIIEEILSSPGLEIPEVLVSRRPLSAVAETPAAAAAAAAPPAAKPASSPPLIIPAYKRCPKGKRRRVKGGPCYTIKKKEVEVNEKKRETYRLKRTSAEIKQGLSVPVVEVVPEPAPPSVEAVQPDPVLEPTPPQPDPVLEPTPPQPDPVLEPTPPQPEPMLEPTPPQPEPVLEPTPPQPDPVPEPTPTPAQEEEPKIIFDIPEEHSPEPSPKQEIAGEDPPTMAEEQAAFVAAASTASRDGLYPSLNDPNFSQKIARRQEFFNSQYDTQVYPVEIQANMLCNIKFELQPHQSFVRNFLSVDTPYRTMLLYHGLGTGKTCTAIGVAEEMRSYLKQVGSSQPIMVVANPNVAKNFRKELFNESLLPKDLSLLAKQPANGCIGNKLLREINPSLNFSNISREEFVKMVHRTISRYYKFAGYQKLKTDILELVKNDHGLGKLGEQSIANIRARFNNTLLIIDEIHNIRGVSDNSAKMKKIGELLMLVVSHAQNMRLLLLSATPVYNSYSEIIWLTNLLNANDGRPRIKVSDVFYVQTRDDQTEGEFRQAQQVNSADGGGSATIESGHDLLKRKLTGYVSFIRGENPYSFPYRIYPDTFNPERTFTLPLLTKEDAPTLPYPTTDPFGDPIPEAETLKYVRLYVDPLSAASPQEKVYQCSLQALVATAGEDEIRKYSFNNMPIIQCLNITFPGAEECTAANANRFYGDEGFNQVVENTAVPGGEAVQYTYRPGAVRVFSPAELGKYSTKMHSVLERIRASTGIVLIYSQFLKSGVLSMALALEEAGFVRWGGRPLLTQPTMTTKLDATTMQPTLGTKTPATYIMITGDKALSPNNEAHIRDVIQSDNRYGHRIKVVLISGAGSEGIDLKNIRQVHILDPWYNLNRNEQIIGRAVRHKSHCSLPFFERNVEIYLHTAYLGPGSNECMDAFLYRHYAEKKSVQIAKINRLLKEVSVDVLLNVGQMNMTADKLMALHENQNIRLQLSSRRADGRANEVFYAVGDKPHTEICDYAECAYTAEKAPDVSEVLSTTYNERFLERTRNILLPRIKALFRERSFYSKQDLFRRLNTPKPFHVDEVYSALHYLYRTPDEVLVDAYGRVGRLAIQGNTYSFRPQEITSGHAALLESMVPVEWKRGSVMVKLSGPPGATAAEERPEVAAEFVQLESRLRRMMNYLWGSGAEPADPADEWYIRVRSPEIWGFLDQITEAEILRRCMVAHFIESLPISGKIALLKGCRGSEYEEDIMAFFGLSRLEAPEGGLKAGFFLYDEQANRRLGLFPMEAGGEWSQKEDGEILFTGIIDRMMRERERVGSVFGFLALNRSGKTEFKVKEKSVGAAGAFCGQQNKNSKLNTLIMKAFAGLGIDLAPLLAKLKIPQYCCLVECLMRTATLGSDTVYFLSREQFAILYKAV